MPIIVITIVCVVVCKDQMQMYISFELFAESFHILCINYSFLVRKKYIRGYNEESPSNLKIIISRTSLHPKKREREREQVRNVDTITDDKGDIQRCMRYTITIKYVFGAVLAGEFFLVKIIDSFVIFS